MILAVGKRRSIWSRGGSQVVAVSGAGRPRSCIEAGVVFEEERQFDVSANFFMVGIDMAGPTPMAHGTPE